MKKLLLFIVSILGLVLSAQAQQVRVGICVFGNNEDISEYRRNLIAAKAHTHIVNKTDFVVLERSGEFMQAINDEIDFQLTGEVRNDQIADIGASFGANYVAVFIVYRDKETTHGLLEGRLIHVPTKTVIKSMDDERDVSSPTAWTPMINMVLERMFQQN